jgi:hypothetical protein
VTRATILAQLAQAKAAVGVGDCDRALGAIEIAWDDLRAYSQALAAAGKSTSAALKMHKQVTAAYMVVRRHCTGNELIAPSFGPRAASPDLIAPSFHGGMLVDDGGNKPWLGLGAAALMLAGGFWACMRR